MVFWNIVAAIVLNLIAYALMPKPQTQKPKALEDVRVPSIEEGKEIPVIFGTMEVSPFIGWYGNFRTEAIKADSGKK